MSSFPKTTPFPFACVSLSLRPLGSNQASSQSQDAGILRILFVPLFCYPATNVMM